jgi:hypothetical protein
MCALDRGARFALQRARFRRTTLLLALSISAACDGSSSSSASAGTGGAATSGQASSGASGAGGAAMYDGCAKFDSTYAAIQKAVFENHGCTANSCHGSARQAGLDLRADASYASLFQVKAQGSALMRLEPSAPQLSYLYLKLAAATRPGSVQIANSPMPLGAAPLSEAELEAIRLWILGGAPQTGSVGDSSQYGSTDGIAAALDACLPKADPVMVAPLDPPPPAEGIQLRSPRWQLAAGKEKEGCVATYYDLSNVIPDEFKSPDGTKFYSNGSQLRQDPGSHHYVLSNPGIGAQYATDPAFGQWTCSVEKQGEPCDPLSANPCGAEGVCGAAWRDTLACVGYGPVVPGSNDLLGGDGLIENVQAANQTLPPRDGVYRELPIRGFLYHDIHGFNLTSQDASLQTRLNVYFAKDRKRRLVQAIDYSNVFLPAGTPPFSEKTVCANHVAPAGAEMIRLTSHMHKRGKRFWVSDAQGTMIYENFLYSDPLYKEYDPGMLFSGDESARTLRVCATYNNGVKPDGTPDPATVTRYSRLPDRTQCKPEACVSGKIGAKCSGADDAASCDSTPGAGDGQCDACAIAAGPTTENEMFVIMPWYVLPEGQ